jgi:hypothetical protein
MGKETMKLLKTVQSLHSKGSVTLTAAEQRIIEQETRELLSAARTASKAPEGFDKLLNELKGIQNADEAFEAVLSFLKDRGELDTDSVKDKSEEMKPVKGPEKSEESEESEEEEESEEVKPGKGPEMKKDMPGKGLEDKKELPGKGPEGKKDMPGKGPKKPMDEEKKDLIARSKKISTESDEDLETLKEDESEEDVTSSESLGIKSSIDISKLRVKVTADRNILVSYEGKPVFLHTASESVRSNDKALAREANKVASWCAFDGLKTAAQKCGTSIIGGVDEGVDLAADAEVPEVTAPVTDSAESDTKEVKTPSTDSVDAQAEFDSKENHKSGGVDEGVDLTTDEAVDATPSSVLDGAEDVTDEAMPASHESTQDAAEVDYSTVEANLKELYKSRATKEARDLNTKFVADFIQSFKIAATRMLLNHDEHQFKIAAFDVLTDDEVVSDMDEDDAAELAEMIASAGHTAFIEQLLNRTSSLMKRSSDYRNDIEKDLEIQNVRPVEASAFSKSSSKSKTAKTARKEAVDGNFNMQIKAPASSFNNTKEDGSIRSVVGSTSLSQRAVKLATLNKGQR